MPDTETRAPRAERPAQERAINWISGGDTGMSSKALWTHMMGGDRPRYGWSYPLDPDDFGRCHRLLKLIPEWRARLPEMAGRSRAWAALVGAWGEIEALYEAEVAATREDRRALSNRTYQRMRQALDAAEREGRADG